MAAGAEGEARIEAIKARFAKAGYRLEFEEHPAAGGTIITAVVIDSHGNRVAAAAHGTGATRLEAAEAVVRAREETLNQREAILKRDPDALG
jgi:hypothetical protein